MGTSDTSWKETSKRFINPYNFISINKDTERQKFEKGTLTGSLSCTLIVKNRLCIPDIEGRIQDKEYEGKRESDKHWKYNFYRVGETPVITGSQLKGMIRTYYEALSNSCLSINNNNILSARHSFPRLPGLLKYDNNGWHLYPADMKPYQKGYELQQNEFKRTWYNKEKEKLKEFVLSINGEEIKCRNLNDAIKDYEENIRIYKDMQGSYFKRREGELTYKLNRDPSRNNMSPVFYEFVSGDEDELPLVYLSPSQMGRSVFNKKLDDILDSHRSCSKSDGECLCKACALFGMISNNDRKERYHSDRKWQLASRLRFSDAVAADGTFSSKRGITLKPLSGPKITSTEFYAKRPEGAKAWTYESKITDYVKDENNNDVPVRELCEVELRGRKFYLHNPELKERDYCAANKTNLNGTFELCDKGSRFTFDVFFENISETQLKELVWTLALGDNRESSDLMFKLGHGKPLGLGSVKILVGDVRIREFDRENFRYNIKESDPSAYLSDIPFDADSDYFKEFMKIVNYRTISTALSGGAVMSYPVADDMSGSRNSKASHQWFIGNRSSGKDGSSTAWSIKYALPEITEDDLTLPEYEKTGEKKDENRRKRRDNSPPRTYSSGNGNIGLGSYMKVKHKQKNNT